MMRIILSGCNGHMGQVITELTDKDPQAEIVAGLDIGKGKEKTYPVYAHPAEITEDADVLIDFSTPAAVDGLLDYCLEKNLPFVLCTTGLSEKQVERVKEVSGRIPILRSANMSVGINLLLKLLSAAVPVLASEGFDMEVVEAHHRRKVDAPSGTALMIADALNEAAGGDYERITERVSKREARKEKEIGISSIRGGSIAGVHSVIFAGEEEVLEIRHTAASRTIFGRGALSAARFLVRQPAGFYTMADVIG